MNSSMAGEPEPTGQGMFDSISRNHLSFSAMHRTSLLLLMSALLLLPMTLRQATPAAAQATGLGFGGVSVTDGTRIFVGSAPMGWPRGDEPAGSVYEFRLGEDGSWTNTARIMAPDGTIGDDFGRTMALEGETLLIGAPGLSVVHVYGLDAAGNWTAVAALRPSTLPEGAEFGGAFARAGSRTQNVALSPAFAAVNAFNAEKNDGQVHVFVPGADGSWRESSILRPDDAVPGDGFGFSVAARGDILVVGAPGADERSGAVYAYRVAADGSAVLEARMTPDGAPGPAGLGTSLAMHQAHLIAGAPLLAGGGGVFVYDGYNNWVEMARASAPETEGFRMAGFGASLAVSDTDVLVGTRRGVVFATRFSAEPDFRMIEAPGERQSPGFGVGLALAGDVAVIGSPTADFEAGISTVFERSAASGRWVATDILDSEVGHFEAVTGRDVRCEDGGAGAFACEGVDLVAFLPIKDLASQRGVGMTDIWGWTDNVTGKEWVLAGRTEGVAFVDISNPNNPVYVGELPKTATSPGSGWRDVKVYRDHAYVVADGAEHHGVQVFDLRQLRDVKPEDMPVTFMETNWYGGVASTHNFVINEESGFGYAVGNRSGGETCQGQLHMLDLSDPANPVFAGCFSATETGGTHDSQCVVYRGPDADYQGREICFNSNGSSFVIADVTDKQSPVTIVNTKYPLLAYTHQGWLTDDHRYFYMNDELDELNNLVEGTRTLIWDVADLDDPLLVSEYTSDVAASDHNLYIKGNLMYQANYQAGLRVLDISDPLNPVEIGYFDTVPFGVDEPGFGGAWSSYPYFESGIIPVTSRGEGLFLLRKQEQDL